MSDTHIRAINKTKSDFPIATLSLIGLNVAVHATTAFLSAEDRGEFQKMFGLVAQNPHFLNMFTSSFLHNDWIHLLLNMFFLWMFGRTLERALGPLAYIMLYVGSGLFAAVTHLAIVYAFMPDAAMQPSLGASGAIAGILGMYSIRFVRQRLHIFGSEMPAGLLLIMWLILQIFLGVLSLYVPDPRLRIVDYWAHMGGFIFGMVVAQLTHMATVGRKEYLITDAEDSFRRGTLLDVVRKYEALLTYDSTDSFANAELGRTWALLDDEEQAVRYYSIAIDLYLKTNRGAEAAARYRELMGIFRAAQIPADLMLGLGCHFEEADRPRRAVEALSKVCPPHAAGPDCEAALLRIAHIQLNRMERRDLASETLERFIETYPNSESLALAQDLLASARAESPPHN